MWRWTYARYSLVADEEQKKKVLRIYVLKFKTYTGYSRVADEKVLGGNCLFKLPKGGNFIKEFGKPWST